MNHRLSSCLPIVWVIVWVIVLIIAAGVSGCDAKPQIAQDLPAASNDSSAVQDCGENRPQMCIEIYKPVCGNRDTGIRCITAEGCESTEKVEYANSCKACADEKVYSFTLGPCNKTDSEELNKAPL